MKPFIRSTAFKGVSPPDTVRFVKIIMLNVITASALSIEALHAQEGLLFDPINNSSLGRQLNLKLEGWANFGFSYNTGSPRDGYNGPVTFTDTDGEVQLNQLYLGIERFIDKQGYQWDAGGRMDFLFGSDAQFTQAHGDPNGHWDLQLTDNRFYNIAFPQAYLELFAPFGNGVTAKLGHFYTIIGNESVMAPDNFFYSHSYTMQYGEPFTHTGLLFDYPLVTSGSQALSGWSLIAKLGAITGGVTGGWDAAFDHGLGSWRFLGGLSINSPDGDTSFDMTSSSGPTSEQNQANWNLYSLVFKQQLTEPMQYTLQFDHGWLEHSKQQAKATWMGLVNSISYAFDPGLALGFRLEWFRDQNRFRVFSPAREMSPVNEASSYYAATVGLKWQPEAWVMIRPNLRFDWSDGAQPFDSGHSDHQLLLSLDATVRF